jgi:hypothetical protein
VCGDYRESAYVKMRIDRIPIDVSLRNRWELFFVRILPPPTPNSIVQIGLGFSAIALQPTPKATFSASTVQANEKTCFNHIDARFCDWHLILRNQRSRK